MTRTQAPGRRWSAGVAVVTMIIGTALGSTTSSAAGEDIAFGGPTHYKVSTIGVGSKPTDVAVDPGVHRAYAVNYDDNTVTVIDTTAPMQAARSVIYLGGGRGPDHPVDYEPSNVAVDPAAHRAYVTFQSGGLVAIDTTSDRLVWRTRLDKPGGLAVDDSTHLVYVAETDAHDVAVVDPSTRSASTRIELDEAPNGVAVDPSLHRVYVGAVYSLKVFVIDTATNEVLGEPISVESPPGNIVVDPVAHRAYLAGANSGRVTVLDTTTNKILGAPISTGGDNLNGMAVDATAHRLYVERFVNPDSADPPPPPPANAVSVIDTTTESVVGEPIPVDSPAAGVAVDPDTGRVYVADGNNYAPDGSDTMSVIRPDPNAPVVFTSPRPLPPKVGGSYYVSASDGYSGEQVDLLIDPSSTSDCSIEKQDDGDYSVVTVNSVGRCVVAATASDAPTGRQAVHVGRADQLIGYDPVDPGTRRVGRATFFMFTAVLLISPSRSASPHRALGRASARSSRSTNTVPVSNSPHPANASSSYTRPDRRTTSRRRLITRSSMSPERSRRGQIKVTPSAATVLRPGAEVKLQERLVRPMASATRPGQGPIDDARADRVAPRRRPGCLRPADLSADAYPARC